MADRSPCSPLAALGTIALAVSAYLVGLDSIYIPSIGDEPLYLQITRLTAASGRWLPLVSERGIHDTKPPLIFWLGRLATDGGAAWELWRLRLPMVALTFTTSAAVGVLAARISGRRATGLLAAVLFLGFRSTIQHGRPFLTNAAETLLLFLPLVLLQGRLKTDWRPALACGTCLGLASLDKSFFLVVPGTFGLALVLWQREGRSAGRLVARHGRFLGLTAAIGLAAFAVWPLLDPRPDLIVSRFLVHENAEKLRPEGYLGGLVSGTYPLWRIWLGDLANGGLHAPLLVALGVDLWRRRRSVPPAEQELWLFVLAFLLVYSLPSQRQENYLLPSCAALAVLLAVRWEALPGWVLRGTLALLAASALAVPVLEQALNDRLGQGLFEPWMALPPLGLGAAALAGACRERWARAAYPVLAVGALLVVSSVLMPFSRAFPARVADELRGQVVAFPDRFNQAQELYRFLLPGVEIQGYPCPRGPEPCAGPVPAPGLHAALLLAPAQPLPPGWSELASLPHLRQRHSPAQVRALLGGDLDLLVERLVLARATGP